jgi:opacity protein-like surface antigen
VRKLIVLAVVLFSLSLYGVAADTPKVDVYGGYSFLHVGSGVSGVDGLNTSGWDAEVSGNFNRYLGITADISGQYKNDLFGTNANGRLHNFLFGPTLTYRSKSKLTPFGHALFGVSHASGDNVTSDNAFAMAFGGGLDVKVAKAVSLRLGQLDWLQTRFVDDSQNHFRYSAGVVFNLK